MEKKSSAWCAELERRRRAWLLLCHAGAELWRVRLYFWTREDVLDRTGMDILPQDSARDGASHSPRVWTWWGWAAESGEGGVRECHLVSSQDVTPALSQPCSVFSLGKRTLKSDMTDDTFHFHTPKLCFVFAEPSLMPWTWARQSSFVLAPRFCHQALVPVACVRDGQIWLCLSCVLHDGVCIFFMPLL